MVKRMRRWTWRSCILGVARQRLPSLCCARRSSSCRRTRASIPHSARPASARSASRKPKRITVARWSSMRRTSSPRCAWATCCATAGGWRKPRRRRGARSSWTTRRWPAISRLAWRMKARGRMEPAIRAFRRALELDPAAAQSMQQLALALREEDRLEEAEAQLRAALRLRPDSAGLLADHGMVLADLMRYDEALACFDRALAARAAVGHRDQPQGADRRPPRRPGAGPRAAARSRAPRAQGRPRAVQHRPASPQVRRIRRGLGRLRAAPRLRDLHRQAPPLSAAGMGWRTARGPHAPRPAGAGAGRRDHVRLLHPGGGGAGEARDRRVRPQARGDLPALVSAMHGGLAPAHARQRLGPAHRSRGPDAADRGGLARLPLPAQRRAIFRSTRASSRPTRPAWRRGERGLARSGPGARSACRGRAAWASPAASAAR